MREYSQKFIVIHSTTNGTCNGWMILTWSQSLPLTRLSMSMSTIEYRIVVFFFSFFPRTFTQLRPVDKRQNSVKLSRVQCTLYSVLDEINTIAEKKKKKLWIGHSEFIVLIFCAIETFVINSVRRIYLARTAKSNTHNTRYCFLLVSFRLFFFFLIFRCIAFLKKPEGEFRESDCATAGIHYKCVPTAVLHKTFNNGFTFNTVCV